jgi:hypothetical protein
MCGRRDCDRQTDVRSSVSRPFASIAHIIRKYIACPWNRIIQGASTNLRARSTTVALHADASAGTVYI